MNGLRGSRILLTGASSGLGRALALELAGEGAALYLTGRNQARLKASAREAQARGGRLSYGPLEVRSEPSVRNAVTKARRFLGGIDTLVHCAGGEFAWGGFRSQKPELEGRQIETNYLGTLRLIRAVLPTMLEEGAGTVVTMASLTGIIPTPGMATYGASKFALVGLSRALDLELKPQGVRVLCVLPPNADTPMLRGVVLPGYPKPVSPAEVARAVVAGLRKKKPLIWVGLSRPLSWLHRLVPGYVEWELARRFHHQ